MIKGNPDISIIIPVYNTGILLQEAVDSILGQTCPSGGSLPYFEIIVIDDHSNDPITLNLLANLGQKDSRIKIIKNIRSKGVSGARNTGILAATGEWIAFLDSDDLWLENALVDRWRAVDQYKDAKWVAAHFFLMRPETGIDHQSLKERSPNLYKIIQEDYVLKRVSVLKHPVELFFKNCAVGILTVMIKRNLILEFDMFDETLFRAEDYHLWLRCAVNNDLYYVPSDVGIYRLRLGSLTRSSKPTFYFEHVMLEKLRSDPEFEPYRKEIRNRMEFVLNDYCYFFRKRGKMKEAAKWALYLIREWPLRLQSWKQLLASTLRIN